jgi:serine/threonine-protein kinase
MAPEQARGEIVDKRADLFGLGVVLWETATGRRLWNNLQDVQILAQLLSGSIPTPRSVDPTVPERLEQICMKALAFEPKDRYPTASAMQADLDAYIASLGLTPTRRALGEAVAQAFAPDRAHLKQVIEEQMRNASLLSTAEAPAVAYAPSSIPSSPSALVPRPSGAVSIRGIPTLVENGGTNGGRTAAGAVRSIVPSAASSERRGRAGTIGMALVGLGMLVVVGFVVKARLASSAGAADPNATTASGTSSANANANANATSTTAAPTSSGDDPNGAGTPGSTHLAARVAHVTLRGAPAGATLLLDGQPVTLGADGALERPVGESHRLKVEAAGFVSDERTLAFDSDRTVDVKLTRARGGTSVTGGAGGPKTTGTAAHPGNKPADPSDVLGY